VKSKPAKKKRQLHMPAADDVRGTSRQIRVIVLGGVAAAVAVTLLVWGTARRAIELSTEGGVLQLTDPLRPIRGTTRVLLITLDGVGDADLRFAIRSGNLLLKDARHALAIDEETDPPALVRRAGYRLRPFALEVGERDRDYQTVLAYHGAFASIYVADRASCPSPGDRCAWTAPPRFEQDVLPLARAFDRANRAGDLVPELQGTLDLIFVREPRPLGEPPLPFQVWEGAQAVPIGEYLQRNPRPDLLRLEERLDALATRPYGHRSGDILVLARTGMNRPIEERFYFSSQNHSWHGSPEAQDSRVPILVAHARLSGEDLRRRVARTIGASASLLDLVPLLESLLEVGPEGAGGGSRSCNSSRHSFPIITRAGEPQQIMRVCGRHDS
jgi:hypothetical protein